MTESNDSHLLRKINDKTYNSAKIYKDRVKAVLDAEEDVDQDKRLAVRECKCCYYIHNQRIAGSAFTKWNCLGCDKEGNHPNTGTPKYCWACSFKYRVCVTCAGDLNMATKRRNLTYDKK